MRRQAIYTYGLITWNGPKSGPTRKHGWPDCPSWRTGRRPVAHPGGLAADWSPGRTKCPSSLGSVAGLVSVLPPSYSPHECSTFWFHDFIKSLHMHELSLDLLELFGLASGERPRCNWYYIKEGAKFANYIILEICLSFALLLIDYAGACEEDGQEKK